jgi:hypothetical protein
MLTRHNNPGPQDGHLKWSNMNADCGKVQCVANGGGGGENRPYRFFGNNSSTYLDKVLKRCGFPPIVMMGRDL